MFDLFLQEVTAGFFEKTVRAFVQYAFSAPCYIALQLARIVKKESAGVASLTLSAARNGCFVVVYFLQVKLAFAFVFFADSTEDLCFVPNTGLALIAQRRIGFVL